MGGGQEVEVDSQTADGSMRPSGLLLALLVLLGGSAILVIGALSGRYFFISKGTILPLLLLGAMLSGQTRAFLRDWLLFLSLLLLFDTLRGTIYLAIFEWHLPWYMGYAIRLEELIFGVPSASHWVHDTWPELVASPLVRSLMVMVHASHFLYFLGFGFVVYRLAPHHFRLYTTAMTLVMAGGLVGYLLVPTVPPWMAADFFGVLPPIERLLDETYNSYIPTILVGLQTNHIAAMPSLHVAFPTTCCAIAWHLFGWRAWPALVYTVLTLVSPIYLAEHYAVDVLAGIGLGLAAYLVAVSWRAIPAPEVEAPEGDRETGWGDLISYIGARRLLACTVIFYVAAGSGFFNEGSRFPGLLPNERFIERELAGRTELVNFFKGTLALQEGHHESARRQLTESLKQPVVGHEEFLGYVLLLEVAIRANAVPLLIEVLEGMPSDLKTPLGREALEEAHRRVVSLPGTVRTN